MLNGLIQMLNVDAERINTDAKRTYVWTLTDAKTDAKNVFVVVRGSSDRHS